LNNLFTTDFIKTAPISVAILDKNLCFTSYSKIWLKEFNIKKKNILGKYYYDIIPNTPEQLRKVHQNGLHGKSSNIAGKKFVDADGNIQWLKWKVDSWNDYEGNNAGIIIFAEDITAIKREGELLTKIESVSKIGGWELDLAINQLHLTDVTKKILEVANDYIPNTDENIKFIKEGEHLEKFIKLIGNCVEKGKSYDEELLIVTAKGNELWVRTKGEAEFYKGKNIRVFGTFQDIDSEKRIELKYKEVAGRLKIAANAAQIGIWEYDFVNDSHLWNDQVYKLHGMKKEDFTGGYEAWRSLIHPEDLEKTKIEEEMVLNGKKDLDHNYRVVWPNGDIRHLQAKAVFTKGEKGNPLKMIGTNWDITPVKEAEAELTALLGVTNEQNDNLLNFAHIVSHNLRSHSSNLSMLSSFLVNEENEEERKNLITMIDEATSGLNETVQHLNEVVHVKKTQVNGNMASINLYTALKNVEKNISTLFKKKEVICEIDVPKSHNLKAVPAYLDSILLNLFTNSVKYSADNRQPQIMVSSKKEGNQVVVAFSDNGRGIDLDRHGHKLFGMYKTFHGNKDAKGIGLFITKNQIEAMNGKIEVESTVNVGTTFNLYFDAN